MNVNLFPSSVELLSDVILYGRLVVILIYMIVTFPSQHSYGVTSLVSNHYKSIEMPIGEVIQLFVFPLLDTASYN